MLARHDQEDVPQAASGLIHHGEGGKGNQAGRAGGRGGGGTQALHDALACLEPVQSFCIRRETCQTTPMCDQSRLRSVSSIQAFLVVCVLIKLINAEL